MSEYKNEFGNGAKGIQIQQNTYNSTQNITYSEFDYEKANKIINELSKHIDDLELSTQTKDVIKNKIDEIIPLIKEKRDGHKIKQVIYDIKNVLMGVGESLIASGILYWISTL